MTTILRDSGQIRGFRNPSNGYEERIGAPWFWCLLFGCFYLAYKGAWGNAVIAFVLALLTSGVSWLIYPFFARSIVVKTYLRRGWIPVAWWTRESDESGESN